MRIDYYINSPATQLQVDALTSFYDTLNNGCGYTGGALGVSALAPLDLPDLKRGPIQYKAYICLELSPQHVVST
jgi:hypothetical protein